MTKNSKSKSLIKKLIRVTALLLVLGILIRIGAHFFLYQNTQALTTSGETRRYALHVPESYDPNFPTPLVISIHGFAEWPAHMAQISHWNDLADEEGFIVVYPAGTGFPLRWATYAAHAGPKNPEQETAFIADLIRTLSEEYTIDPTQIYASGFSNGGGMSFLLSCSMADQFAAIGSVAGAYLADSNDCTPTRPVPFIHFHGTADPIVPYSGGSSASFELPFPDIPTWVEQVASRNQCAPAPVSLPASGSVSGIQYTGCAGGADVIFYSIEGGGHTWPGGEGMPEFITGKTTQDVDATRLMWDFFQQHPLTASTP